MSHPHSPPARKLSALNVTAFVLSLLFILPLVPAIGAILGIVGAVRHRPDLRGRGLAIAAIPVGFGVVIFVQGLLAAIAIPSFMRYTRKAKAVEAQESIQRLRRSAAELIGEQGRFPVGRTEWVPKTPCCEQPGRRCSGGSAEWDAEPWRRLGFGMADRHYFQYRYQSDGQTLSIEARGDLDCDGQYSSYRLDGSIQDGHPAFGPIEIENELE
ncbi:MAG: hypothetical protein RBU30_02635 [Polyangia bacterium]|nr:hypothetical protein [Polyangia bacterium]